MLLCMTYDTDMVMHEPVGREIKYALSQYMQRGK